MRSDEQKKKHAAYMKEYARRTGYQKAAYDDPVKLEKQREKWREANRRWRTKNPERHRAFAKRYYHANAEECCKKARQWTVENKEKAALRAKLYEANNKERMREYRRNFYRLQRETNLNYRIKHLLQGRIFTALKRRGLRKSISTAEVTGCSIELLRGHLEAKFRDGMSWENIGKWHIDHVIPCAEFDLRDEAQQKLAFHYTNLQPLWAIENMKKGKKRVPNSTPS